VSEIILGVDGGGTSTRAVLLEQNGRVIGSGVGGASNYHNVGVAGAVSALRDAVAAAWNGAGSKATPAAAGFFGLAGIKSGRDRATMRGAIELAGLVLQDAIEVQNDVFNALAGGLKGRPGIALIAGTGCNALGSDVHGRVMMCGGWGWLMGDDGAGFGIAREGLRAAARSADGRSKKTRLLAAAMAFFGVAEPDELLARFYVGEWNAGEVAAFAPVVMRLADEGETMSRRILRDGADALAEIVATLARDLDFQKGPEVVLMGGCVTGGPSYQPMVEAAILKKVPKAHFHPPEYPPLYGAAINALKLAGCRRTTVKNFPIPISQ